jgi:GMP synthase-like glutamine amidotransferase
MINDKLNITSIAEIKILKYNYILMTYFILIIDNTNNKKYFFNFLIDFLKKSSIRYQVISSSEALYEIRYKWSYIKGIILTGSNDNISEKLYIEPFSKTICALYYIRKPILGICFGFQLLNVMLGGKISKMKSPCNSDILVNKSPYINHVLLDGLNSTFNVYSSHTDHIVKLAPSFNLLAFTEEVNQVFYDDINRLYGVQFHPEKNQSTHVILENFIFKICLY